MELRPEAVALAKRLHWASPKTGKRMSLRKIASALAEAGHAACKRPACAQRHLLGLAIRCAFTGHDNVAHLTFELESNG